MTRPPCARSTARATRWTARCLCACFTVVAVDEPPSQVRVRPRRLLVRGPPLQSPLSASYAAAGIATAEPAAAINVALEATTAVTIAVTPSVSQLR